MIDALDTGDCPPDRILVGYIEFDSRGGGPKLRLSSLQPAQNRPPAAPSAARAPRAARRQIVDIRRSPLPDMSASRCLGREYRVFIILTAKHKRPGRLNRASFA